MAKKKRLRKLKFNRKNPWFIGIGVGIISSIVSGVLVTVLFLHREQRITRNFLITRVRFADKCLKAELAEEALRGYDDILKESQEQDKHLYAYIRNQTARCYLCLAKRGIEKKRNLIRAAVAFEESLIASGSERWRQSIFAELELSGVYWSLSWFQDVEANIAKSVELFEDVRKLYPGLQYNTPFIRMGIIPGDHIFTIEGESPAAERDIKKNIEHGNETLKVCTIEKYPVAYALIQSRMGFYYLDLAYFRDKTENLHTSIKAFSNSLKIFTYDEYPLNYIDLKSNIALAYLNLSDVRDKSKNIRHAIEILGEASRIASLEKYPDKYEQTREALAFGYLKLSSVEDEERNIAKAITCCKDALKVCKQDKTTFTYASVQDKLGHLYLNLSKIKDKDINMKNSVDFLERAVNAFKVCEQDRATFNYANVQERLGYSYLNLSEIKDKEKNIKNSVESFKRALNVLDSEKYPLDYKRVSLMLECVKKRDEKDQFKEASK